MSRRIKTRVYLSARELTKIRGEFLQGESLKPLAMKYGVDLVTLMRHAAPWKKDRERIQEEHKREQDKKYRDRLEAREILQDSFKKLAMIRVKDIFDQPEEEVKKIAKAMFPDGRAVSTLLTLVESDEKVFGKSLHVHQQELEIAGAAAPTVDASTTNNTVQARVELSEEQTREVVDFVRNLKRLREHAQAQQKVIEQKDE